MNPIVLALVAVVGPVLGAAVTYFVARRQHSGKIDTSEAATLWAESNTMRQELREEVVARREEIVALREENAKCREDLQDLRREMRQVKRALKAEP